MDGFVLHWILLIPAPAKPGLTGAGLPIGPAGLSFDPATFLPGCAGTARQAQGAKLL